MNSKRLNELVLIIVFSLILAGVSKAGELYWTGGYHHTIYTADVNSLVIMKVATIGGNISDITLDTSSSYLYWVVSSGYGQVGRLDLLSGNNEILVTGGFGGGYMRLHDIALDIEDGRFYFSDYYNRAIYRANLDGTNIETIVEPHGSPWGPGGIDIDIVSGKIYWCDGGMQRANLDGTGKEFLFNAECSDLNLDIVNKKIYWCRSGRIRRANFSGTNKELVIDTGLQMPAFSLDPFEMKLYWTGTTRGVIGQTAHSLIQRCNMDGTNLETLYDFGTTIKDLPAAMTYVHEPNSVLSHAPVACIVDGNTMCEGEGVWGATVVLDGSCSSDADSNEGTNDDIEYFDWYEIIDGNDPNSDIFLGSGEIIDCNLGLGEHNILLEVIDKASETDTNEVTISVVDTTPPEFSLSVRPEVLWPANHKMVEIAVEWEVSDLCDEDVEVRLVSITSNEADDGNGDIQIIGGKIYLRAERSGAGEGRVYTITYEAVDDSGNSTQQSAIVTVPHDMGKVK